MSSRCRDKKSGDEGGDISAELFGGKRGEESGVIGLCIGVSDGEGVTGGAEDGGVEGVGGIASKGLGMT